MLLRRTQTDPRYDQQVSPVRAKRIDTLNNSPSREAKRFPAVVNVVRHSQPPCHGGETGTESIGGVQQNVRDSQQAVPSPVFREEPMQNIAYELQQMVFQAAGTIHPGMSIKAQLNAACDNLGYPRGNWRVREAWYGTAGNWRGEAIFDMIGRYNRLVQKRAAGGRGNMALPPAANDPFTNLCTSVETT
ncbi:hypothetical protein C7441_11082 [Pseudaminobacter salicylatoxidans]|uniref:Uncharacterized protein n=1 Tax=Pseudaminobacter salicylatoxidans TaxID=93369 RepID=A0A316C0M0_PSESE|nr:hypothetical protein [Pseudaminobacter salicylatoxidans]PWJ81550.1 hypothetical protein C7441_11082 [Pseudaminobacter salicylatoxidans]